MVGASIFWALIFIIDCHDLAKRPNMSGPKAMLRHLTGSNIT